MTDWEEIVEALRMGNRESSDDEGPGACDALAEKLEEHIEANGIADARLVFGQFSQNPAEWADLLAVCLQKSGTGPGEDLVRLAREIRKSADCTAVEGASYRINGNSINGPVQAENLDRLDQSFFNNTRVVLAQNGSRVYMGSEGDVSVREDGTALERYLAHAIAESRFLQLQGIRSGGKLVDIELERIYITLRINPDMGDCGEEAWLSMQAQAAPGEEMRHECLAARGVERESISVNEALAKHDRLVVLGDPGSGKTTLLRYLALLYAGDMATGDGRVREKLGLD